MTGNRQHKLKLTIKSNDYGQLRFEADRVYQFEKGILGMQDFKDYALFPIEDSPLACFIRLMNRSVLFLCQQLK